MLSHFEARNCLPDLNYRNCRSEADQRLVPLTRSWQGLGQLCTPGPCVVLPSETIKETVSDGNKTKLVLCFKGK